MKQTRLLTPETAHEFRQLYASLASQLRNNALKPNPRRELNLDAADVIETMSEMIIDLLRTKDALERVIDELGYTITIVDTDKKSGWEHPGYSVESL